MPCVRNWNTWPTAVTRVVTGDLVCWWWTNKQSPALILSSHVMWLCRSKTAVGLQVAAEDVRGLFQSKCWQNTLVADHFTSSNIFTYFSISGWALSECSKYLIEIVPAAVTFCSDKKALSSDGPASVSFLEAAAGDDPPSIWRVPDGPAMWKVSVRPLTHWIVDQMNRAVALKRLWPSCSWPVVFAWVFEEKALRRTPGLFSVSVLQLATEQLFTGDLQRSATAASWQIVLILR